MDLRGAARLAAALALAVTAGGCGSGGHRAPGPAVPAPPTGPGGTAVPSLPPGGPPLTMPSFRPGGGLTAPEAHWGRPVLADGFSGNRLDPAKWQVYDAPAAGSHPGTPAGVRVSGGVLWLTGGLYGGRDESAGIFSRLAQTYGRWEARIRADPGDGYSATAFLWPTRLGMPEWAEVDFAEILDPTRRSGALFIHHGRDDEQVQRTARVDFTRWHTVAVDWLPSHLTFWVDGKALWTYRGPFVPQHADMHLYLRNEVRTGFRRTASAPKRVTMEVDWARVFRAPMTAR